MDSLTSETYNPDNLPAAFVKKYGGTEDSVQLFSSPARINIIFCVRLQAFDVLVFIINIYILICDIISLNRYANCRL